MRIFRAAFLFLVFCPFFAYSQETARVTSGVDLGLGYRDEQWVPAITYHQDLGLANFPWLRIGWGVRAWGYYTGKSDLKPKENSVSDDYLKFGRITTNGLSFMAGANFRFGKLDIGANTDLLGIAIGAKRKGLYTKKYAFEGDEAGYYNTLVKSSPNLINALPILLDDQNGQSELYLRYWITSTVGLKLGYVVGRTTYSTPEAMDNGQKRFFRNYSVPSLSISFPLYN
jgi:hypothetical protein